MSSVNKCLLCLIGKVTTLWKSYNPSERSEPFHKSHNFLHKSCQPTYIKTFLTFTLKSHLFIKGVTIFGQLFIKVATLRKSHNFS
uniref:Putative ovule protein n=1 Tax=Solanum chacoense TaxID=4108 RepID=A0A0V0GK62_SOLCH